MVKVGIFVSKRVSPVITFAGDPASGLVYGIDANSMGTGTGGVNIADEHTPIGFSPTIVGATADARL